MEGTQKRGPDLPSGRAWVSSVWDAAASCLSSLGPVVQNLPQRGSTQRVWAGSQDTCSPKEGGGPSGERGLMRRRSSC